MFSRVIAVSRHMRLVSVFLVAIVVLILGVTASESWAKQNSSKNELEFADAEVFIEFNFTDQDVGIQVMLDGDPWRRVKMKNPAGRKLLDIRTQRSLRQQGLSELFFESSEPSLAEVSLAEFLNRFPEGEYEFEGKTIDGVEIEGAGELTHNIPCGPVLAEGAVLDPNNAVIEWEPVTKMINSTGEACSDNDLTSPIVSYQVIVETSGSFDVILPVEDGNTPTQLTVPAEVLDENTAYKFEILAKEESGNQTISSSFFCTNSECEAP